MIDIDAIRKRTEELRKKCFEKSEELVDELEVSSSEEAPSDAETEKDSNASNERQVEILGQMFSHDDMAQMAANEELLKKMID